MSISDTDYVNDNRINIKLTPLKLFVDTPTQQQIKEKVYFLLAR
jgi:hypothetical protein